MIEKNYVPKPMAIYEPSGFTKFLWWLSTAEKELLIDAVVDRNRHKIIGMTVLATWAFATLAWTYFFSTVAATIWFAIPLGLFMGFIILTIDRALIKGINKFSTQKLWPLLFRGLLAVTIGVFMAQPALLYLFNKEIKLQTSLDNEKRKKAKSLELNSLFKSKKETLLADKENLNKEAATKYADIIKAKDNFLAETDGSGGSGKVGIKTVAMAKKIEYLKLETAYQSLISTQLPAKNSIDIELKNIEETIKKEEVDFAKYFNDGFLTQSEALNNLIENNRALQFRYYLLVMILLLIELMPVIAKTILPSGTYDEQAMLQENMEKEIAQTCINKTKQLKEFYNDLAYQNDVEIMTAFFDLTKKDRINKIKENSQTWSEGNGGTFDDLATNMKRTLLTGQIS